MRVNKALLVAFVFIAIISINTDTAWSKASNYGLIRIYMHEFPYANDPYGADYRSHKKLGDVGAYVIRIYNSNSINWFISGPVKNADELGMDFGDMTVIWPDNILRGRFVVTEARELLQAKLVREITTMLFKDGGRFEVFIPSKSRPPYVDVPLPEDTYFIEYSLHFNDAARYTDQNVHPNYPHLSATDNSIVWGPAKVVVRNGMTTRIEFQPTNNINFYRYPDFKEGEFENFTAFEEWMKYLLWAGHVSR